MPNSVVAPTTSTAAANFSQLNANQENIKLAPLLNNNNNNNSKEEIMKTTMKKRNIFQRIAFTLSEYSKSVAHDYATVFKEIGMEAKTRPIKAVIVAGVLVGAIYAYKTNPTERDLKSNLAELRHQMTLLPVAIQSQTADRALNNYTNLLNTNRLDYYDLLLFSLIVQRKYDRKDWPWYELWENLIDIGALNKFWNLEKSFENYDINESEFS